MLLENARRWGCLCQDAKTHPGTGFGQWLLESHFSFGIRTHIELTTNSNWNPLDEQIRLGTTFGSQLRTVHDIWSTLTTSHGSREQSGRPICVTTEGGCGRRVRDFARNLKLLFCCSWSWCFRQTWASLSRARFFALEKWYCNSGMTCFLKATVASCDVLLRQLRPTRAIFRILPRLD